MSLYEMVVILAVLGIVLYLFNRYATFIAQPAKQIITWVVVGVMIFVVLQATGILSVFKTVQVPHV